LDYNRLTGPQRKVMRGAIAGVFPDRHDLNMFLEDSGFESLDSVVREGGYEDQLFEFVKRYAARGKLNGLVGDIRSQFPESPAVIDLDVRLGLVAGGGAVAEQAANSQGGLERIVRNSGETDLYLWTEKLLQIGRRICRIRYPVRNGIVYGTGFLIGPAQVLTNFHVIEHLRTGAADSKTVRVRFDYAERAHDRSEGIDYGLADDWQGKYAPYSTADLEVDAGLPDAGELDFAVIRIADAAGEALTDIKEPRGWIDLAEAGDPPGDDAIVFILQHPEGQPIKQTIGITKHSPTALRLRYDADTEGGSSGALVLDANLRPVALHHAGDPDSKIKARYNQGIPLALIRAALDDGASE
jgi:hypothetical protein